MKIEVFGLPIVHAACYCSDCQTAGRHIESLPGAAAVLDSDGGTASLLYRRDRVSHGSSRQLLRPHKIKASSPTSRLVTTCCNCAMYLDFEKGHWLTLYRKRFAGDVPPLEMRICTKSRRSGVELPQDVPNYPGRSFGFFVKLLTAWIPMLLRR
ncbi:MAG: hypothetical protein ACXWJM_00080 [Ramlibacter sp.]